MLYKLYLLNIVLHIQVVVFLQRVYTYIKRSTSTLPLKFFSIFALGHWENVYFEHKCQISLFKGHRLNIFALHIHFSMLPIATWQVGQQKTLFSFLSLLANKPALWLIGGWLSDVESFSIRVECIFMLYTDSYVVNSLTRL